MSIKRMTHFFLGSCAVLLIAFILLATSPSGLPLIYTLLLPFIPGKLVITHLRGSLLGNIAFDRLDYYSSAVDVHAENGQLNWSVGNVLNNEIVFKQIKGDRLRFEIPHTEGSHFQLSDLSLPVTFIIQEAALNQVEIRLPDQRVIQFQKATLRGFSDRKRIAVENLAGFYQEEAFHFAGELGFSPGSLDFLLSYDQHPTPPIVIKASFREKRQQWVGNATFSSAFEGNLQFTQQPKKEGAWELKGSFHCKSSDLICQLAQANTAEATLKATGNKMTYQALIDLKGSYPSPGLPDFSLTLKPSGKLVGEHWQSGITGDWKNIRFSIQDQTYQSDEGTFQIAGRPDQYEFNVVGQFSSHFVPTGYWRLQGSGDQSSVFFKQVESQVLDGTLVGKAQLSWKDKLKWQTDLQFENLNLQSYARSALKVSGHYHHAGEWSSQGLDSTHDFSQLKGSWENQPLSGNLEFKTKQSHVSEITSQLKVGGNTLMAAGTLYPLYHFQGQLELPDLKAFWDKLEGRLSFSAHVEGDQQNPHFNLSLTGKDLTYSRSRQSWTLSELQSEAVGALSDHTIRFAAQKGESFLAGKITGQAIAPNWSGVLSEFYFTSPKSYAWSLEKPAHITFSPSHQALTDFCWQAVSQRICAEGSHHFAQDWKTALNVQHLDLSQMNEFIDWPVTLSTQLNLHFELAQQTQTGMTGALKAALEKGEIRFVEKNLEKRLPLEEANVSSTLNQQGLFNEARLSLGETGHLHLIADFPGYRGQLPYNPQQAIAGNWQIDFAHLPLLSLFLPHGMEAEGKLKSQLTWQGTLQQPEFRGKVDLTEGRVQLSAIKTPIENITLSAEAHRSDSLTYIGQANLGKGLLKLAGETTFQPTRQSTFSLQGKQLRLVDKNDNHLIISPNLTLKLDKEQLKIGGSVEIPEASFNYKDNLDTVNLPAETVYVSEEKAEQSQFFHKPFYLQLAIALGDNVFFQLGKAKGYLKGNLTLFNIPGKPLAGQGDLKIYQGSYTEFGQAFQIQNGQILYAGGPLDNPALNIRAIKEITQIVRPGEGENALSQNELQNIPQEKKGIVGVQIQGTVREPKVSLFSDPPGMNEADILSYLVLGYPSQKANNTDSRQALWQALNTLQINGNNVASVQKKLQNLTQLDEINIENSVYLDPNAANPTQQNTSLVLGKTILPRLFVGYSIGLFAPINTLTIKYQLTPKLSLKGQSNTLGTGADVFYTFETD